MAIAREGNIAALVQLKSETDFSAKADDFVARPAHGQRRARRRGGGLDALKDEVDSLKILKKENIEIGKVARFEAAQGNALDAYLHAQDGRGTNGVLIEIAGADEAAAHEIALHVAFANRRR